MSDIAYDWPRGVDLELSVTHNLWLRRAWVSMGKTSCTSRSTLISPGPGGKSAKVSRHLDEICLLSQPSSCLLGLITERAFDYLPQQGIAPQGGVRGCLEGGIIAISQTDASWKGVLHPRKMATTVWENDLAQGSWCLSLQLPPQSHKSQNLLMQL